MPCSTRTRREECAFRRCSGISSYHSGGFFFALAVRWRHHAPTGLGTQTLVADIGALSGDELPPVLVPGGRTTHPDLAPVDDPGLPARAEIVDDLGERAQSEVGRDGVAPGSPAAVAPHRTHAQVRSSRYGTSRPERRAWRPRRRCTRVANRRSTKSSLCLTQAPTTRRRGRDVSMAWCRSCHNGPTSVMRPPSTAAPRAPRAGGLPAGLAWYLGVTTRTVRFHCRKAKERWSMLSPRFSRARGDSSDRQPHQSRRHARLSGPGTAGRGMGLRRVGRAAPTGRRHRLSHPAARSARRGQSAADRRGGLGAGAARRSTTSTAVRCRSADHRPAPQFATLLVTAPGAAASGIREGLLERRYAIPSPARV